MVRFCRFAIVGLLFLSACAKSPGFKATDYDYRPADQPQIGSPKTSPESGAIIRGSDKIDFKPVDWNKQSSDWSKGQDIRVKANVKVGDKSLGDVEFQGTKKDSRVFLEPVSEELKDQLKAQMVCLSEDASCNDFFIEAFYKENNVIYQKQILADHKPEKATAPDSKVETKSGDNKPVEKATETKANKAKIQDGVSTDEAESQKVSYVGSSDEEIRQIFHVKNPETKPTPPSPAKQNPNPGPAKTPPKSAVPNPNQGSSNSGENQAPDTSTDELEKLKTVDQAVGRPDQGRLQNGTDFLKISGLPGFSFFIVSPREKHYYGVFDLVELLKKMGEALESMMPGRKLGVTAISKWNGVPVDPHVGHQNGTDIDIHYLRNDENLSSDMVVNGAISKNFQLANQWKLLKKTFETNLVEVVFVDPVIKRALCNEARRSQDYTNGDDSSEGAEILKRLQTWPGHDNHFHVRIKCTENNRRCLRINMNFKNVGC